MEVYPRAPSQEDVSSYDDFLCIIGDPLHPQELCHLPCIHRACSCQGMVLTVGHDRKLKHTGILHSLFHQPCIHNRLPIFADGADSCLGHLADVGQLFSLLFFCDGPDGQHMNNSFFFCFHLDILYQDLIINHWVGIGHTAYGGESSLGCTSASGCNGFLVLEARLSQVDVDIDQSRHHPAAASIDYIVCFRIDLFLNLYNMFILNQYVFDSIGLGNRI